jgi:hypothetical protein
VKTKANLILLRIQRKFTKATEEQQRAQENARGSIERAFQGQASVWESIPKGVGEIIFAYAVVPEDVRAGIERALRAANIGRT